MKPINKPWTEEDNERLRKLCASGATLTRAAAAFSRNTAGIQAQAKKLGLRFPTSRESRRQAEKLLR